MNRNQLALTTVSFRPHLWDKSLFLHIPIEENCSRSTGADDKVVRRVLRHAKPDVTRERCIKVSEYSGAGYDAKNANDLGAVELWPAIGQQSFTDWW